MTKRPFMSSVDLRYS